MTTEDGRGPSPSANSKPRSMRTETFLVIIALTGAAAPAQADSLPIDRGYYVESGTSCEKASNATITLYDGVSFGEAHMQCRKRLLGKLADGSYRITESCRDMQGRGGPWQTLVSTYVISSRTEFTTTTPFGKFSYRYCKQSDLPEPWSKVDLNSHVGN